MPVHQYFPMHDILQNGNRIYNIQITKHALRDVRCLGSFDKVSQEHLAYDLRSWQLENAIVQP